MEWIAGISGCATLYTELLEVVVDVLVHPVGPLVWGEVSEEAVGMGSASAGAGGGESVDDAAELFGFDSEVALIGDDEAWDGGGVAAHGLALLESHWLDDASDEAADEHAWGTAFAASEFHADGAVGHGLSGSHFAPETRGVGAQARHPVFQFLDGLWLPESFHGGGSLEVMISAALLAHRDGFLPVPSTPPPPGGGTCFHRLTAEWRAKYLIPGDLDSKY